MLGGTKTQNMDISKLLEQLENNTSCLSQLERRCEFTKKTNYYNLFFASHYEREKDLAWILKIRKRVLRMRFKLLEKIESETKRHMHLAHEEMRSLTDKIKA